MNGDLPASIVLSCHHISSALPAAVSCNVAQNSILTLNYVLDNEAFCGFACKETANTGANRKKRMPDGEGGVSTATAARFSRSMAVFRKSAIMTCPMGGKEK
jgi:hypothetical protein